MKSPGLPPPLPSSRPTIASTSRVTILAAALLALLLFVLLMLLLGRGTGGTGSGTGSGDTYASGPTASESDVSGDAHSTSGGDSAKDPVESEPTAHDPPADKEAIDAAEQGTESPATPPATEPGTDADEGRPRQPGFENDDQDSPSPVPPIATVPSFSGGGADFFGIRQVGTDFAFIVDHSSSMAAGDVLEGSSRFALACDELMRTLKRLDKQHRICLLLFNDHFTAPPEFQMCHVTGSKRKQVEGLLDRMMPGGGTDPTDALLHAISQEVDGIYIVSDGEFDPMIVELVVRQNANRIPIHSICIGADASTLQDLSNRTGGRYRSVR